MQRPSRAGGALRQLNREDQAHLQTRPPAIAALFVVMHANGREGSLVVVLLCGGSKKSQATDIVSAQREWKEYLDAKANG